jgi:hypothetical protein
MAFTSTRALQAASGLGGGYTIDQSLRFNDDDSAYLSWTPASAGNRKTWTWSGWVKRGNLGIYRSIFGAYGSTGGQGELSFDSSNRLLLREYAVETNSETFNVVTTPVYRDVSAWYHIVAVFDSTQSTASNRIKLYVNGDQVTALSTASYPSLNFEGYNINNLSNKTQVIADQSAGSYSFDGYLADVHFIDGQALDPSYFGETDEDYGHWKPIAYEGSYGTNGFYLDFSNLGEDQSGNNNDWTANNLAATDVVLDSPTNNFCTLNPLVKILGSPTYSEGNLQFNGGSGSGDDLYRGSIGTGSSGKWYFECCPKTLSGSGVFMVGASYDTATNGAEGAYQQDGRIFNQSVSVVDTVATYTTGDIIGIAIDVDNGTINYYKNNSLQGSSSFTAGSNMFPSGRDNSSNVEQVVFNFGQDSSFAGQLTAQNNTDDNGVGDFYYAPPSGFLALCTANLPDPAVIPGENFNTVLWTGDGNNDRSITGYGFNPDWVWLKMRSSEASQSHRLTDRVRGGSLALQSNSSNAEASDTSIKSFITDGFTTDANGGSNGSGRTYVAWGWKADNTSGSSNTDGSITSTVAANPSAGFSVVSYTGVNSASTLGHGLSQAPELVIVKNRSNAYGWCVGTDYLTSWSYFLRLDNTDAEALNATRFGTAPTSSVFTVGYSAETCQASNNYIAYCFHSVDGYSKFGSYTGNGSSDGPFVYTGFRPAFVIWKNASASADWHLRDTKMSPYNVSDEGLFPNGSYAESTDSSYAVDILSNGFKPRNGTYAWNNASGATYIYMAFAEFPFKYTTAR